MRSNVLLMSVGFIVASLIAELVLQFLPVSTGYRFGPVNAEQPILHGAPRSPYLYSRGWNLQLRNSGVLNNAGFRSSYDYLPDPDSVAVIGNSFIQADALNPRDTLAEGLAAMLHRPVYAIGVDGYSLADYLAAARWAGDRYGSTTFILLTTTGDLKRSCERHPGQHSLVDRDGRIALELAPRPAPGRAKELANDSALFRYLFDNLKIQGNWLKGWRRAGDAEPAAQPMASGCASMDFLRDATAYLLEGFGQLQRERGARVWFLLPPGYRREEGFRAGDLRDVDYFSDLAAAAGFPVVKLDESFKDALQRGQRLDFMPLDGHWNAAANRIAAQAMARAMTATP
jgi:hypothetical protein